MKNKNTYLGLRLGGLITLSALFALFLAVPLAFADVTQTVNVNVPASCTLSGSNNVYSSTITPGTSGTVGPSNIKAVCNDGDGLAIYAVGFSEDNYRNTDLVSSTSTIATGIAGSPTASQWNMTVAQSSGISGNLLATISDGTNGTENFTQPHVIPATYTKVASYSSTTDQNVGVNIAPSYTVYIASNQAAGSYEGKVKYTLVRPASHAAPETPVAVPHQICYYGNGADDGSMACQTTIDIAGSTTAISTNAEVQLRASNFSRADYGYAGWNTKEDGTGTPYGPMETITFTQDMYDNGLALFANWVPAETGVTMQTFNASAFEFANPTKTIIALRDIRDDDVYAVAKLADGKWWMIENLRLDYNANITTSNTQSNNDAWGDAFIGLAEPESTNFSSSTVSNTLYSTSNITGNNQQIRFPRYNNDNTDSRAANNDTGNTNVYSYGNYYTWAAAVADTGNYLNNNTSVTDTSLCPTGWRLPVGGSGVTTDYKTLNSSVNSDTTSSSAGLRAYPTNLIYSGYYNTYRALGRGENGAYWSSTNNSSGAAYIETISDNYTNRGTGSGTKSYGNAVRCLTD